MHRVVITGLGTVNPLGNDVETYWKNLKNNENGIVKIDRFDASSYYSQIAGEVKGFEPLKRLTPKEVKKSDLYAQYALYAAQEAITDSGLDFERENGDRIGVIIASGIGGLSTLEREHQKLLEQGPKRISPFLVPMMIPDMAAGLVSMKYSLKGPNYAIVSACASSSHAMGEAFHKIKYGYADIMITGGGEAPITPLSVAGFSSMKALSPRNEEPDKASRPFDAARNGFVIGEGAGILVFEELEHAKKRGAKIYAEIAGYGATCDAFHMTQPAPEGEGAYRSMLLALQDAEVEPDSIDYINAHGTSTVLNDKFETIAIKRVFGDRAYKIPVSSTKSMTGHTLGASGSIELVAVALSIKDGVIHPTRNYENRDEYCDLDYVPEGAREINLKAAISNSFGFGGHNATLLLKKFT